MAQIDIPLAAGAGRAYKADSGVWATTRNAATAQAVDTAPTVTTQPLYNNQRYFIPFKTSLIPDDAVLVSAVLRLYRQDTPNAMVNDDATRFVIVPTSQADPLVLVVGDYGSISFVSKGSLNFASAVNHAYVDINIADLSIFNKTGYTKLALISGRDFDDVAPAGVNSCFFDGLGDANPPVLRINYTPQKVGSMLQMIK